MDVLKTIGGTRGQVGNPRSSTAIALRSTAQSRFQIPVNFLKFDFVCGAEHLNEPLAAFDDLPELPLLLERKARRRELDPGVNDVLPEHRNEGVGRIRTLGHAIHNRWERDCYIDGRLVRAFIMRTLLTCILSSVEPPDQTPRTSSIAQSQSQ